MPDRTKVTEDKYYYDDESWSFVYHVFVHASMGTWMQIPGEFLYRDQAEEIARAIANAIVLERS